MKLCIFGSRDWYPTPEEIDAWLGGDSGDIAPFWMDNPPLYTGLCRGDITEVVSGCARGADIGGERWAEKNGIAVRRFPADWEKHGKSAGFRRNTEMARYCDCALAFWKGQSPGTANTIAKLVALGKLVKVSTW